MTSEHGEDAEMYDVVSALAPDRPQLGGVLGPPVAKGSKVVPSLSLDRDEGVELTAQELRHWSETSEWPERVG